MSETAVNPDPTPQSFFLDGDAPRLAAVPSAAVAPDARTRPLDAPKIELPEGAPTLPVVSPVLSSAEARMQPEASAPAEGGSDGPAAEPAHPMAHLMPAKSKPSEAAKRAAEQRAVKKAKAKKIKIGVAVGFLTVSVLVGPPLFKWLANAINEAGGLSTEEPAD